MINVPAITGIEPSMCVARLATDSRSPLTDGRLLFGGQVECVENRCHRWVVV